MKYTVESALTAKSNGTLKNWVIGLLLSEENFELAEKIATEKTVAIEMFNVPLALINRIKGPEENEAYRKPPEKWNEEVSKMVERLDNDYSPAPIIVTDFWNHFEIADGNHRHEALERRGVKSYWTIFFIKHETGRKYLLDKIKYQTFFIDVGGVLIRTENTIARKRWEKKLHLKPRQLTHELYKIQPAAGATIGQVSADTIWKNVAEKFSLSASDLKQLRKDFFAGDKLNQDLYTFVRKIHNDYKVVLFTNGWDDVRKTNIEKFHLDKICDNMIISAEVGMRKPRKKIFKMALNIMNATAAESLYIDDKMENIKVGREIGFHTILFKHTNDAISKIKEFIAKP